MIEIATSPACGGILAMTKSLGIILSRVHAEHPKNLLFFVAAVTTGVDTDGGKFAAFAPALNGKSGNTKNLSYLGNG